MSAVVAVWIVAAILAVVYGVVAYRFGYRAGTRVCPPLNVHEAAMYDRFVEFLIQRGRIEEQEALSEDGGRMGTQEPGHRANGPGRGLSPVKGR